MIIRKAVIPAAGLGTRFLPATKSMPKEMLPIVDTPAVHFVVKEAIEAGIDDIIIITGRGKRAIEDYFDESPELEMHLEKKGKKEQLEMVREISQMVNIHYIRQKEPKGLPDAILRAEKHVGDEPFAVLLGDDIIKGSPPCIKQLIDVFEKYGSTVLAAQKVPLVEISKYGSIKGKLVEDRVYLVEDIVEKPKPEEAPSNVASVGRYVFTPTIFDCIRATPVGLNDELQIADSLSILREKENIYAFEFIGRRYDIGDKFGYIEAIIDFSLENKEIGDKVRDYLSKLIRD
ncbi:MAG: UTP--glucose-1-phosphate uridylyltransferase [Thermoplasmata archaeon]|nr:MAG: UTP--glucose-1-phosphate uridylyltransferase [Thermoplasmata archaeon]RLF60738.1 MAG: UTP--glucose-1-phosphate uridylyltransferase [Thermoplasmata archaeon]RLF80866.1 MAG: UTP--glucose-1-phosphate uridylyltransferase [Thermococci archaeon]